MAVLLKSFTGVGVSYRHSEEAEAEGQHDDVQHEVLLAALVSVYRCTLSGGQLAIGHE